MQPFSFTQTFSHDRPKLRSATTVLLMLLFSSCRLDGRLIWPGFTLSRFTSSRCAWRPGGSGRSAAPLWQSSRSSRDLSFAPHYPASRAMTPAPSIPMPSLAWFFIPPLPGPFPPGATSAAAWNPWSRSADALRNLAADLSAAEDAQRRQLAHDLHDALGQNLSLLAYPARIHRPRCSGSAKDAATRLSGEVSRINSLIQQTRTFMFDLYPPDAR